LDIWLRSQEQ